MSWLPEDKRDTTWYLSSPKFHCRIPFRETQTPDQIRMFGTAVSGDPRTDARMQSHLVDRMMTVFEIAAHYAQGHDIRVKNVKDTMTIYEYVENHLLHWRDLLYQSASYQDRAPLKDLVALDGLAGSLYEHTKHQLPVDWTNRWIFGRPGVKISATSNVLQRMRGLAPTAPEDTRDRDDAGFPLRSSFADVFENATTRKRRSNTRGSR